MCKYHKNIELIIPGLVKLIPGMPNCSDILVDSTVCSHEEKCMDGACSKSGDVKAVYDLFRGISKDTPVSYYQWTT